MRKKRLIGRKRLPRKIGEYHSMAAMPSPAKWGDKPAPAKTPNGWRLEKGELRFEVLHIRLFPDRPIMPPEREDKVIGKLSDEVRRPVLPTVVQPRDPEPPHSGRLPVDDEISEYSRRGDSDAIRDALFEQIRMLIFRIFVHSIVFIFLGLIELLPMVGVELPEMFLPDRSPAIYLSLNLVMSGFCLFLCRHIYAGGFESILKLKPDGDGMLSIAATGVMLHMAAELVYYFVTRQPVHRVCGAPLVCALLINDIGLLVMTRRVARNFKFVALRGMSMAAKLMNNDLVFDEVLHADKQRRANVAYPVRTRFLANYLHFAYEQDFCEQMCFHLTPYASFIALAAGIIGGLTSFKDTGAWGGVYCLCATLVAGIPVCRLLCLNVPMDISARRMLPRGVMLNGWAGADEFGSADTLAVSSDMLFPRGTVKLVSSRAFGEAPLDRSVLYAAAVVMAAGGPLAQIFEEIFEGRLDMIPQAEAIDYENEMGVSGYVDSRPVLVGNRRMLEVHGCAMPSRDYESLIKNGGRQNIVYIAISGVPCAVLTVEYISDFETVSAVQRMVENGVSMVVYTCDANVTRKLISNLYGIPARFVTIMSTRAGSQYDRLTHTILDKAPAVLATNGRLSALAEGITCARRLRPMLVFTSIIQLVCYGLGLFLVALLCCIAGSTAVYPAQIMLLQLVCVMASLVGIIYR